MIGIDNLTPKYITNETGEIISVVLPISRFLTLLEDIEDLAAIVERREEPTIYHADLLNNLRHDGLI